MGGLDSYECTIIRRNGHTNFFLNSAEVLNRTGIGWHKLPITSKDTHF